MKSVFSEAACATRFAAGLLWAMASLGCQLSGTDLRPQLPPAEAGSRSPVQLFREVVSFRIGGGTVQGQGFYYFRNADSITRAFPASLQFFVSNWQGQPRNLQLAQILPQHDDNLPYVWLDQSCPLTQIVVPPSSDYCLRVDWEQPLSSRRFIYVLRREPPWNPRRDLLRLTLQVPPHYRRVRMNYPASHKFRTDQSRSFVIAREDFAPTQDLIVTWEE